MPAIPTVPCRACGVELVWSTGLNAWAARRVQDALCGSTRDSVHVPGGGLEAARKSVRAGRKTTDPGLVEIVHSWNGTAPDVYVCQGCGKTSSNGGAFGFHVRACTKLDAHDVTPALIAFEADARAWAITHAMLDELSVEEAYEKLTPLGKHFMALVGNRHFDFFDDGIVEHSGNWGENLTWQAAPALGVKITSMGGIMAGVRHLWNVTVEAEYNAIQGTEVWWSLTKLGAAVARHAANVHS